MSKHTGKTQQIETINLNSKNKDSLTKQSYSTPAMNIKIIPNLMDITDFLHMAILVSQCLHELELLVRAHT